ncbi:TetR-like C-terminal domain-containing protein [Kribbella sp. NPDC055110]
MDHRQPRDPRRLTARPSITLAASFRTPDAAHALTRFWEDRYARTALVVERAVGRGELPAGTDPHPILLTATAPLYHQLVLLQQPMSRSQADHHARVAAGR